MSERINVSRASLKNVFFWCSQWHIWIDAKLSHGYLWSHLKISIRWNKPRFLFRSPLLRYASRGFLYVNFSLYSLSYYVDWIILLFVWFSFWEKIVSHNLDFSADADWRLSFGGNVDGNEWNDSWSGKCRLGSTRLEFCLETLLGILWKIFTNVYKIA